MLSVHEMVTNITIPGYTWEDLCLKYVRNPSGEATATTNDFKSTSPRVPSTKVPPGVLTEVGIYLMTHGGRLKSDVSVATVKSLPTNLQCKIFNNLEKRCLSLSILDIWKYSRSTIERLTDQEIINAVNDVTDR